MDVLNTLSLPMSELSEMFIDFSPVNMLINRSNGNIKMDISALENISLAILSDN